MADPKHLGGDRWKVAVFLGRDADGRQIRPTRTFTADGIRAARKKAASIEAELRAAGARTDSALTVAQAAEDWWELWSKRGRSPRTREDYRRILDVHVLKWRLKDRPVREITTGQIDRWYASIPREKSSGVRKVGPARVRRIHAVVVQIFDQCVRDGELVVNPAKLARKPEANAERPQFVALEVVELIVAAAYKAHPVRGRALAFAGRTGLRRGEMAGLRWSRVLQEGAVLVDRAVVEVAGRFVDPKANCWPANGKGEKFPAGRWLIEKDTKAHQAETIALEAADLLLLTKQAEWQRAQAQLAGVKMPADPFLFAYRPPFDRPPHPNDLSDWHAKACADAKVEDVRLHDLRHHHLSVYLAAGATLEETRQRARHKSITTTMGYLEADRGRQRELLSRLAPLELPSADEG